MSRDLVIGRHQAAVLVVLVTQHPQTIEAYVLARIADPNGDLSRGRRVLNSMIERGLIAQDREAEYRIQDVRFRFLVLRKGVEALAYWLNKNSLRMIGRV